MVTRTSELICHFIVVFNVDRYYRIYRSLTSFLSLSPDAKNGNRSAITQLSVSSKTTSVDNGQY